MNGWCLIPPSVYAATVPPNAKLLYGRVLGMVNDLGSCYAGNEFLGKQIGVEPRTVQRLISNLVDTGFLRVEQEGERRLLTPCIRGDRNVAPRGDKNVTLDVTPVQEQVHDNDVPSNKEKERKILWLFNYWVHQRNLVMGSDKKLKLTGARRNAISGRISDGYTVEEIKLAILGCLSREFNVTNGYVDITLICRATKIDQYIASAKIINDESGPELEEWSG